MRRLALMGADKGPCVSARGIRRPHLRVVGLPLGGKVTAMTDQGTKIYIFQDGLHSLEADLLEWVEVLCEAAKGHKTICEIISTKVA